MDKHNNNTIWRSYKLVIVSWTVLPNCALYPYCGSHSYVCANRPQGFKCVGLYVGLSLQVGYKKVLAELYREKAELWFTKAPHLLVTHGKYPLVMVLLSSAVADAQVASKATIWALNGLCRVKKCRFQFPSLPQKCS